MSCYHEVGEFKSPIFSVPKKDGRERLIHNLTNRRHIDTSRVKGGSRDLCLLLMTLDQSSVMRRTHKRLQA